MSQTIVIKTQAELDALPDSFPEFTYIQIQGGTPFEKIIVRKARGSAHVVARESAHVVARESAHVVAWESAHVVARGSAHVVARESAHVEAWESAHVVARGSVAVHNHSVGTTLELYAFAAAWLIAKAKNLARHGDNTTVIHPERSKGAEGWLEDDAVAVTDGKAVIFKRVSNDWKTQEFTANETVWIVGTTVTHKAWNPTEEECGEGKFHGCSRPYFCDQFRIDAGDRYLAIEVKVADLHAWENGVYPHKIAFREGKVLHEVNKYGQPLAASAS